MKFKIDENLPQDVAEFLAIHGYDAATVGDEGLSGTPDQKLATVCRTEGRALLTLDLDFADLRAYPPSEYEGFVVLRLAHQDKPHVLATVARLLDAFDVEPLAGRLWIVEEQRIRIRGDDGTNT